MKLRTMRGAFKKYGKDFPIVGDKRSISYPKIPYVRPKNSVFIKGPSFDKVLDSLI